MPEENRGPWSKKFKKRWFMVLLALNVLDASCISAID